MVFPSEPGVGGRPSGGVPSSPFVPGRHKRVEGEWILMIGGCIAVWLHLFQKSRVYALLA